METTFKTPIEPTVQNLEMIFSKIAQYADAKGYQMKDKALLLDPKTPNFKSNNQRKLVRNHCTRLNDKITMSHANRFLHLIFKNIYGVEKAPRVEYSEKELKIKANKKAWKKLQAEADVALKAYKDEKGDFYKQK